MTIALPLEDGISQKIRSVSKSFVEYHSKRHGQGKRKNDTFVDYSRGLVDAVRQQSHDGGNESQNGATGRPACCEVGGNVVHNVAKHEVTLSPFIWRFATTSFYDRPSHRIPTVEETVAHA